MLSTLIKHRTLRIAYQPFRAISQDRHFARVSGIMVTYHVVEALKVPQGMDVSSTRSFRVGCPRETA